MGKLKTKKEIEEKLEELQSDKEGAKSPRRKSKIIALAWALGRVSDI